MPARELKRVAALIDTAAAGAQLREKLERLLQETLDQVVRCELVQQGQHCGLRSRLEAARLTHRSNW